MTPGNVRKIVDAIKYAYNSSRDVETRKLVMK